MRRIALRLSFVLGALIAGSGLALAEEPCPREPMPNCDPNQDRGLFDTIENLGAEGCYEARRQWYREKLRCEEETTRQEEQTADQLAAQQARINKRLKATRVKLAALETGNTKLKGEIEALEDKTETQAATKAELELQLRALEEKTAQARAQAKVAKDSKSADALEAEVQQLERQRDELTDAINKAYE
jgi:predicted  nucleic acid-binding Zn-ribbon protein